MKIKELKLYSNDISNLKKFYSELLDFKILENSVDSFSIAIGSSKLIFIKYKIPINYHFAINISSNKIHEVKDWLSKRVEILPFDGSSIVDFPNWKARSIYF